MTTKIAPMATGRPPQKLDRLLRPASIAVFGGAWAEGVLQQCRALGFQGALWPVHPSKRKMAGLKCYASIADLPGPPDASFIAVNRFQSVEIVAELSASGAGGAICFAAGFREASADDARAAGLQDDLVRAAGEMPVLGPNCYGLINYLDRVALWPDQHGGVAVEKGVAIVAQSSNIAVSLSMQNRALPIAYMVTIGNQAQTGLAAVAADLLQDPRVTALGLYIEGFADLRAWEALAIQAHKLGKPIVALKTGQTEQAQDTAISHSASLAGKDAGAAALLARLGIVRVHGLGGFLESLKLLHFHGGLSGGRLGSLSCSGGEASLIADAVVGHNLNFPALGETTAAELQTALGPLVHLANPLDYNTYIWGDRASLQATFGAMMRADHDLTLLMLDFPRTDRCDPATWRPTLEAYIAAKRETGRAAAVLATLPENLPEDLAEEFLAAGITPLLGLEDGLSAIEAAVAWDGDSWSPPAPLLLPGVTIGAEIVLGEAAAKIALSEYGVAVPASTTVAALEDIPAAAAAIGFPLVVKGLGQAHKTEAELVSLNLPDAAAAEQAAAVMADRAQGYLLERYIDQAVCELLIAVRRDPAHGFVLTLGAGGILTELMDDHVDLLLPAVAGEVMAALAKLKLWPLLQGYRGRAGADLSALIANIAAISDYVTANRDCLEELEVNPYLALNQCGYAVDALIRIRKET